MTAATTQAPPFPNPLADGLERLPIHPTALVIFGATGDLARRKLLPAFYHLFMEGLLPQGFAIVGYARTEETDEGFQEAARQAIKEFARCDPSGDEWAEIGRASCRERV